MTRPRFSSSKIGHHSDLEAFNRGELKSRDFAYSNWSGSFVRKSEAVEIVYGDRLDVVDKRLYSISTCDCCGKKGLADRMTRGFTVYGEELRGKMFHTECVVKIAEAGQSVPMDLMIPHRRMAFSEIDQEPVYVAHAGINGYHTVRRAKDVANDSHPFRVGFEIEKVSGEMYANLGKPEIKKIIPMGWFIETDSSLGASGFELITRAYNLKWMDGFRRDVSLAADLINATANNYCGGHIHVSDCRYNNTDLLARIKPWMPLLMTMYPQRLVKNTYCKLVSFKEASKVAGDKHHAIHLHKTGTLEFRIFPGVKSVKTLLFRAKLIEMILNSVKNRPMTYQQMFDGLSPGGEIRKLLRAVYTHEQFVVRQDIYWRLADFYHHFDRFEGKPEPKVIKLLRKCA